MYKQNIGKRIMTAQEQLTHYQKLQQIYEKKPKKQEKHILRKVLQKKQSSKNNFEALNHLQNIKRLYQRLNNPKNMQDRLKQQTDFYAYPVFFFREQNIISKAVKKNMNKKIKSHKPKKVIYSQNIPKITQNMIKQQLPLLKNFETQNLEQYAEALTNLIIRHHISSKIELNKLENEVIRNIPSHYPQNFIEAIIQIFAKFRQQFQN